MVAASPPLELVHFRIFGFAEERSHHLIFGGHPAGFNFGYLARPGLSMPMRCGTGRSAEGSAGLSARGAPGS